jgi:hypothetical protein
MHSQTLFAEEYVASGRVSGPALGPEILIFAPPPPTRLANLHPGACRSYTDPAPSGGYRSRAARAQVLLAASPRSSACGNGCEIVPKRGYREWPRVRSSRIQCTTETSAPCAHVITRRLCRRPAFRTRSIPKTIRLRRRVPMEEQFFEVPLHPQQGSISINVRHHSSASFREPRVKTVGRQHRRGGWHTLARASGQSDRAHAFAAVVRSEGSAPALPPKPTAECTDAAVRGTPPSPVAPGQGSHVGIRCRRVAFLLSPSRRVPRQIARVLPCWQGRLVPNPFASGLFSCGVPARPPPVPVLRWSFW